MGNVEEIYIAATGGAPMRKVAEIQAEAGAGLAGDRYKERTGYWTGVDECQVTLIEIEAIDYISEHTAVKATNGEHRRNIITRGISLSDLAGRRFRIGGALLEFDRPRPPCRYIQSVSERGMTKALGRGRGGICARVVESGVITTGNEIEVAGAAPARRAEISAAPFSSELAYGKQGADQQRSVTCAAFDGSQPPPRSLRSGRRPYPPLA